MNQIYALNQIMAIYKNIPDNDYFFSLHDVFESKEGEAVLGSGKPLTREALEVVCKAVVPKMIPNMTFLEMKVLGSSGTLIGPDIWWNPPVLRPMFFARGIAIPNGIAPWPGLVFVTNNNRLTHLFAVKGDQRPIPETELFEAPFFNIRGHSLCLGKIRLPKKNNAYAEWEKMVYQTAFSGDIRDEKRIAGKETLDDFWKGLIEGKTGQFPENQLLKNRDPGTVGELFKIFQT